MMNNIERDAFKFLCKGLQRDPESSEENDTCSLRSASRAMASFASRTPRFVINDASVNRVAKAIWELGAADDLSKGDAKIYAVAAIVAMLDEGEAA